MVDEFVLQTALEIEQKFQQAYGFWGTPAPYAVNIVFSLAGLALFVGAWITSRQFIVCQPTPTPLVTTVGQPEIPQVTTETPGERSLTPGIRMKTVRKEMLSAYSCIEL